MTTFAVALSLAAPVAPVQATFEDWLTVAGVRTLAVSLPEGAVQVYLPLDMVGGETISGSVFGRARSDSSLDGILMRILDKDIPVRGSGFRLDVPGDRDRLALSFQRGGATAAEAQVALHGGSRSASQMNVAPVTTVGGALYASGPFDGVRDTTELLVDGQKVGALTESPRGASVSILGRSLGSHSIQIREGGASHEAKFNVVQVRVVAPGTRLSKGQHALQVIAEGLEGVPQSAYPLRIGIVNETPNILRLLDLDTTLVGSRTAEANLGFMSVPFSAVKDGKWVGKLLVRADKVGEFRLTTFSYSQPFVDRWVR